MTTFYLVKNAFRAAGCNYERGDMIKAEVVGEWRNLPLLVGYYLVPIESDEESA